jgi:hypothetical protein
MKRALVMPFANSAEHLAAELAWLDAALAALVRAMPALPPGAPASGHGWFVSAEEVDGLLRGTGQVAVPAAVVRSLWQTRRSIVRRRQASEKDGVALVFSHVSRVFRLSRAEELLLLACFAGDTDDRYGRIYGFLHDDLTRSHPTVQLVGRLLALDPSGESPDSLLRPDSPVFRWELVSNSDARAPLTVRDWLTDPRLVSLLLGHRDLDCQLASFVRPEVVNCQPPPAAWLRALEDQVWQTLEHASHSTLVVFYGAGAEEGRGIAARIGEKLGLGLVHGDLARLMELSLAGPLTFEHGVRRLFRESLLRGAAIYASGFEELRQAPRGDAFLRTFEALAPQVSGPTFVESRSVWLPAETGEHGNRCLPLEIPAPPYAVRRAVWAACLPERTDATRIDGLAARYRFSTRQIQEAARLARTRALADRRQDLEPADVAAACRLYSRIHLDGLARTLTARRGWEDLVLPADVIELLKGICAQCRHRATVFHQWGFERTMSPAQGICGLLVGPSGTGKTLAAEVIASALNADLAKVDLSAVVSKYIGDTEKNLERIFSAAAGSDAVLFFDEADALFGKRSEVHDAHDRYSNIEVSYLLQRIESHDGLVILASNLAQNIDEAFTRRLQFVVPLPFPNEGARLSIWRRHIPDDAPVADDLDLPRIARTFKISGGNIRNVALTAAFLAADEAGGSIGMRHVLCAMRREFARIGKPFPASPIDREEACA